MMAYLENIKEQRIKKKRSNRALKLRQDRRVLIY
jgi:hypothetical protein